MIVVAAAAAAGMGSAAALHRPGGTLLTTAAPQRWGLPVMMACGALYGAVAGLAYTGWIQLGGLLIAAVCSALMTYIDLADMRLPQKLTGVCTMLVAGCWTGEAAATGQWVRLGQAAVLGLVSLTVYFAVGWLARGMFGLGDVTVGGLLGLLVGWYGAKPVLWSSVLATALFTVGAVVTNLVLRRPLRSELPFGPFLLAGAWASLGWIHLVAG